MIRNDSKRFQTLYFRKTLASKPCVNVTVNLLVLTRQLLMFSTKTTIFSGRKLAGSQKTRVVGVVAARLIHSAADRATRIKLL